MKNQFELLVEKDGKKLYNYLRKILRNQEDAEDILQETLLAIYRKFDTIKPQAVESYLYRTAYHKALNHIKKRNTDSKYRSSIIDPELIVEKNVEVVDLGDKNLEIREAMLELGNKYSILIELKYFQNKSYREIAEILDITESAVDSRLVRAKKKLKNNIISRRKTTDLMSEVM